MPTKLQEIPKVVDINNINKPNIPENMIVKKIKIKIKIIERTEYLTLWIILDTAFAIDKVIKNAMIPEIIIAEIIKKRLFNDNVSIRLFTATAAPVLVFWIE